MGLMPTMQLGALGTLLLSGSAVASLSQVWIRAADPAACQPYAVQSGDSCMTIARHANATYAQIISWNPDVNLDCTNLKDFEGKNFCISNPQGNYAIPSNNQGSDQVVTTTAPIPSPTPDDTTSRCGAYHLVEAGEDCSYFTSKFSITLKDFLFLNPHVWENCTNVYKDYHYCVRPVGSISTYPGYLPPTSSKEFVETPTTDLPMVDDPFQNYKNTQPIIPLANNTRVDCYDYLYLENITNTPQLANCWSMAHVYGITAEEFVLWNPSLKQNTSPGSSDAAKDYRYPCTVSESMSYCVALESPTPAPESGTIAPPSPRAAGEIENCTAWFAPQDYDTCESVLLDTFLNIEQFYYMNPSVKKDCTGMTVGTYYCIKSDLELVPPSVTATVTTATATGTSTAITTPTPIQDGMVSTCNKFYMVQSGDGCYDIANDNGVALSDFYAWNPAVKTDCTGLQAKVHVCIGVYSDNEETRTSTVTKVTATSTGGAASTPTPTQDGMIGGCTDFYFVQSGDGCWAIANDRGIDLNDFYSWNPAVKTDCAGLQPNVYVCVGRG